MIKVNDRTHIELCRSEGKQLTTLVVHGFCEPSEMFRDLFHFASNEGYIGDECETHVELLINGLSCFDEKAVGRLPW